MCDHTHVCRRYEKKRILVKAGHKGEFLYYIYNGSVSVTIEHIVDDVTTINLKSGTIFGVSYISLTHVRSRYCINIFSGTKFALWHSEISNT